MITLYAWAWIGQFWWRQTLRQLLGFYLLCQLDVVVVVVGFVVVSSLLLWLISWVSACGRGSGRNRGRVGFSLWPNDSCPLRVVICLRCLRLVKVVWPARLLYSMKIIAGRGRGKRRRRRQLARGFRTQCSRPLAKISVPAGRANVYFQ